MAISRSAAATAEVPLRTRSAPKPKAKVTAVNDNYSELEAQLLQLVDEYYSNNKVANAARGKADKAKKELDRLMAQNEVARVDSEIDGVAVEACYEADTEHVVDIALLRKMVDEPTFMRIVSASQKAVSDALGDNVKNQVLKTQTKDPSLKIRAKK